VRRLSDDVRQPLDGAGIHLIDAAVSGFAVSCGKLKVDTASDRQWRRQEFSFGGYSPGGLGPLVRSGGEAPVEGLRDKVPQKLKQFADIYRL